MEQGKEPAQVQVTKDYQRFKTLSSNRRVDMNHVKRLAKSMKENPHLFETRPILVNENMFVIDGQHRLRAAQENKQPVYYMVSKGITVDDTRTLNTTQANWTMMDFARSYASTGNEHYQTFLAAVSKYPNLQPTVIRFYLGGQASQNALYTQAFKNGDFVVERPNLSDIYLEQLSNIKRHLPNVQLTRAYGLAFYKLFENPEVFDYEYFLGKLENEGAAALMRGSAEMKDAFRCIEDVYNYNRNEKNRVRFY